jgi:2-octaprenyl-6-methoxyphenol hydroxylase
MQRHEIVIIGGGLNGLACAVALAGPSVRMPFEVLLVDAGDPENSRDLKADGRASAITASSRNLFEALGVWSEIAPHAQPMNAIRVTDSSPAAQTRPSLLHFAEHHSTGGPSAYMVENRFLYAALYDAAKASDNVTIRKNSPVAGYEFSNSKAAVELQDGTRLETQLVIAADGRNSPARAAAGIDTVGWSYEQSAIVLSVEHERDHGGQAEENFMPAGPFAILPLPGHRSSLVWTESHADAARILDLDEAGFRRELDSRFGTHLGKVTPGQERFSYPLSLQIVNSFVADRLVLIGDAAHVVHPIAGLGFNLGLRDIAALAEVLNEALKLGADFGAANVLEQYQSWRRLDTMMVALATDGINRLFSSDVAGLRVVRDAGLGLVNRMDTLKRMFMREAAGLSGQLPRLLAGEAL